MNDATRALLTSEISRREAEAFRIGTEIAQVKAHMDELKAEKLAVEAIASGLRESLADEGAISAAGMVAAFARVICETAGTHLLSPSQVRRAATFGRFAGS